MKNTDRLENTGKPADGKTLSAFLGKVGLFAVLIAAVVGFTDRKGYFDPDNTNNHTLRKWNAFYDFTRRNAVDVVLVGNSHLYTGINPKNLSVALGANCFILASPGTTLTDAYFALKEAIAVSKPKIAVVETFTVYDYDTYELKDGALSDQFKSFSARKNIKEKLFSMPFLFNSRHYLPAWSNTVRNHGFIFSDNEQIKYNISLSKRPPVRENRLYLGRYVRFTTGLEDSTLMKYDRPGFTASDGNKHKVGKEAALYIDKIQKLCAKHDIRLIYLTIPSYYRHIANYGRVRDNMKACFDPRIPWLDLQADYDMEAFTPEAFENTVRTNQHLTYYGSLVATYKLAAFIREKCPDVLEDRYKDMKWRRMFYGDEGYFENYPPEKDGINALLMTDTLLNGIAVKEVDFIRTSRANTLLIKTYRTGESAASGFLTATVECFAGGKSFVSELELASSPAYEPPGHRLYRSLPIHPDTRITGVRAIAYKTGR